MSSGVSGVYSSEATGEAGVRGPSSAARSRSRTPKPSPKPSSIPQAETKAEHPDSRYIVCKSARRKKSVEASKPGEQKQRPEIRSQRDPSRRHPPRSPVPRLLTRLVVRYCSSPQVVAQAGSTDYRYCREVPICRPKTLEVARPIEARELRPEEGSLADPGSKGVKSVSQGSRPS